MQKQNRNPEWEPPPNQREEQCKEHMHEVGQQWKKKRQKISRFYKEGTKVQKGLMYKTKGVEPNPKVEMNKSTSNTIKVLTQYNP